MSCKVCGGLVVVESSEGGTTSGRFTEKYECINCGANGWISGEASDPPKKWDKWGRAMEQ